LSGKRLVRLRASHGEASEEFHSPSLDGGRLYFAQEGFDIPNLLHRVDLATDRDETRPAPLYLVGLSAAAGTIVTDVAPGDPTTGASPMCVGTHSPTLPAPTASGCAISADVWQASAGVR
jgi:hypothetical protein